MNRWLLIGSLAGLLFASTGCLHHNTRGGCSTGSCGSSGGCHSGACGTTVGCNSGSCGNGCQSGACGNGCQSGGCHDGSGVLGKLGCGGCNSAGCRTGCVAGPLGWQQGGLDYSSHLQPGLLGHNAGANLQARPFTPGPPTAQVAYPYYSVRGPRDFFLDNPPTIGR